MLRALQLQRLLLLLGQRLCWGLCFFRCVCGYLDVTLILAITINADGGLHVPAFPDSRVVKGRRCLSHCCGG